MRTQALDTALMSLEDFAYAASNKGRQNRNVVDAFGTVAWFNVVRESHENPSIRDLGLLYKGIEESTKENDPERHNNKWNAYRPGCHSPTMPLRRLVSAHSRYPEEIITHVVWDAFRPELSAIENEYKWRNRLHPSIHHIKPNRTLFGDPSPATRFTETDAQRLERRSSLDALAALIIELRLAAERNDSLTASLCNQSACRVLLAIAPQLMRLGVGWPLTEYFNSSIAPMATHNGHYQTLSRDAFIQTYQMLLIGLDEARILARGPIFSPKKQVWLQRAFLDNWYRRNVTWGYHHAIQMAPQSMRLEPDAPVKEKPAF